MIRTSVGVSRQRRKIYAFNLCVFRERVATKADEKRCEEREGETRCDGERQWAKEATCEMRLIDNINSADKMKQYTMWWRRSFVRLVFMVFVRLVPDRPLSRFIRSFAIISCTTENCVCVRHRRNTQNIFQNIHHFITFIFHLNRFWNIFFLEAGSWIGATLRGDNWVVAAQHRSDSRAG